MATRRKWEFSRPFPKAALQLPRRIEEEITSAKIKII
jgi:hypothetical protein